jgi:hypothetical protein
VQEWRTHVPSAVVRLLVGIPFALALHFLICNLGWALKAMPHETGHAIAGWLMGYASIPSITQTIRFGPQLWPLNAAIVGGLCWLAWKLRTRPELSAAVIAVAVVYPFVAFSERRRDIFILWAGHGGESCFGAFFFWRALKGQLTFKDDEPAFYGYACATLGWSSWGYGVAMFYRLITSEAARYQYELATFGREEGTNDYSRIASELGWTVQKAAKTFGIGPALLIPPIGFAIWWVLDRDKLWKDPVELPPWARRGG